MRFNRVHLGSQAADVQLNVPSSLFENRTLLHVAADEPGPFDPRDLNLSCAGDSAFLTVASGRDVNVFSIKDGLVYSQFSTDEYFHVMHSLDSVEPMTVIVDGQHFMIYIGALSEKPLFVYKHCIDLSNAEGGCFVTSSAVRGACHIVFVGPDGSAIRVIVPHWSQLRMASKENILGIAQKAVSSITMERLKLPGGSQHFTMGIAGELTSFGNGAAIAVQYDEKKDPSYLQNLDCPEGLFAELAGGEFVLYIDGNQNMGLYDALSLATIDFVALPIKGTIQDFLVIDEKEDSADFDQLAIVVERDGGTFAEIFSVSDHKVVFSTPVRANTRLLKGGDTERRLLIMVVPFSPEYQSTSKVSDMLQVVELVEALPQVCLERMLRHHQFDVALQFAEKHGLDNQQIYIAHLAHLRDSLSVEGNDESLARFLEVAQKVADKKEVADMCAGAAWRLKDPYLVMKLLEFCAPIKTDEVEALNSLRHSITTFRLVLGDTCEAGLASMIWEKLIKDGELLKVFGMVASLGLMNEAQLLWMRHSHQIVAELQLSGELTGEDQLEEGLSVVPMIFSQVKAGITAKVCCWRDALQLLEVAVIPVFLAEEIIESIHQLWSLVEWLVPTLEANDASNFPTNAIYAAGSIQRVIEELGSKSITPVEQATFCHIARAHAFIGDDKPNVMDGSAKLIRGLTDLHELGATFNCKLTYAEFRDMTREDICGKILDQALGNPAKVRENVDNYARPYMKKYGLPIDETLYTYVEQKSRHMSGLLSTSAYDQYCISVLNAIDNVKIRQRALLEVARLANVPWNPDLKKAVNAVLEEKQTNRTIRQKLTEVCVRVELALLFKKYGLPHDHERLHSYLGTNYSFQMVVRYVLVNTAVDVDTKTREEDLIKIVDLANEMSQRQVLCHDEVATIYCNTLLRSPELKLDSLLDYVGSHEARGKRSVCDGLLESLNAQLDLFIDQDSKVQVATRLLHCTVFESLVIRFRADNARLASVQKDVRALRLLQERFNISQNLAFMHCKVERLAQLRSFFHQHANDEQSLDAVAIVDFAQLLNFTPDEAFCFMLEENDSNLRDVQLTLALIGSISSRAEPLSDHLAELCVDGIEMVLLSIYDLSLQNQTDALEQLFDWTGVLHRKIPNLLRHTSHSIELVDSLIRTHGYLELVHALFAQGAQDEPRITPQPNDSDEIFVTTEKQSETNITSQSMRLGFYQYSMDPALYGKVETAQLVGRVARCVLRQAQTLTDEAIIAEMVEEWEQLFNHLSLHNQNLLEYSARVFASGLGCFRGRQLDMSMSVQMVVQKSIEAHPADLWTAAQVLLTLPTEMMHNMLVRELRQFAAQRRNPQCMLNYLRCTQFLAAVTNKTSEIKSTLLNNFRKASWQKNLRKKGIPSNVCAIATSARADSVLAEFAKTPADPEFVASFLAEFGLPQSLLLEYGTLLFHLASSEYDDDRKRDDLTAKAVQAVELSGEPAQSIVSALFEVCYVLSPYNYSVIESIASMLQEYAESPEIKVSLETLTDVIRFLNDHQRRHEVTKEEYVWYRERERHIEQAKDQQAYSLKSLASDMYARYKQDSMGQEHESDHFYSSSDESLLHYLPKMAKHRLPVHIFLYETFDAIKKFLKPVVDAEIDISTLQKWQALATTVPYIRRAIARTEMLKTAVCKSAKQALLEDQLTEEESDLLWVSTVSTSNRADVIVVLSTCMHSMKTLELRLLFLKLAQRVGNEWLQRTGHYNISEGEAVEIAAKIGAISSLIIRLETELMLINARIPRPYTIEDPARLIREIYCEKIDWTNRQDIESKQQLLARLAEVNQVDLHAIEATLVDSWLLDSNNAEAVVDLNDTMGSIDGAPTAPTSQHQQNDDRFPVFDTSVARIGSLMRHGDLQTYAKKISNIMKRAEYTTEGCARRLLVLSVLIRAFTDEELAALKTDTERVCVGVENTSYMRLFGLASVEMAYEKFTSEEFDRMQFVRSLLDSSRQSQQIAELLAALVIDFEELHDKAIIEKVTDRLVRYRCKEYLALILLRCAANSPLQSVKNLALLWTRVFDWHVSEIGDPLKSDAAAHKFSKWLFRLFACPLPAGRTMDSVRMTLGNRKAAKAEYLAQILAAETTKLGTYKPSATRLHYDMNIEWVGQADEVVTTSSTADGDVDMDDYDDY
ncbi:unnamed protein product, partial [Mesorhabditis spiculigera]